MKKSPVPVRAIIFESVLKNSVIWGSWKIQTLWSLSIHWSLKKNVRWDFDCVWCTWLESKSSPPTHLNFWFKSPDLYVGAHRGVPCRLQWARPRSRFCSFGRKQHCRVLRARKFNSAGLVHASAYTHPFTSQRGTRLTLSKLWLHCLAKLTLQSALSNLEGLRCFLPSDLGSVLHRGIVWPMWTDHRFSRCGTDSYDHPANLQLCLPSLCASYASRSSTRFPGIAHRVGSLRSTH